MKLFSNRACWPVVCGLALVAVTSFAETWYWSPTVKSGSNYPWQNAANWLNSASQRNVGYPAAGDTAVLGDTASSSGTGTYAPDSNRALYEIRIGPGKVVTMNQGDYTLAAGGRGFQYLAASGATGNWGGMRFAGDGDVPINISNNVQFAMQMRMWVNSGSPRIVKQGKGEFVCYNQTAANWNVPEVRVQQGSIDCSMDSGTISNCRFMFDGNDSSQRFLMGYSNHKGLNLNNCGLYETNGVANTAHGFDDRGKGFQVSFTGTPKLNPTVFTGTFYQKAGLKWSPSADAHTFIYSNGVSAAAGVVTVGKGKVVLANGASFTALADLQVSAGATFEVADAPSSPFHSDQLTLGSATAKIKLAEGVNLTVEAATLNALALSPGVYSADGANDTKTAAWIEGPGTVTVVTGPANADTWQGGAAGGTSALLGGNWAGGNDPDLSSGEFFATFASGGSEASLPGGTAAKFDGVMLENTSGNSTFAFTAGDGASATIAANGIKGSSAAATTWNMSWPLVLGAEQAWTLDANDTFVVKGGLSGSDALTLDGAGAVTFDSESTHSGALSIQSGTVRVTASNGLGTNDREVQFQNDKVNLSFAGDISIDARMYGKTSGPDGSANGFTIEPNANVVFNNQVRQYSFGGRVTVDAGATVTFKGGYRQETAGMNSTFAPRGNGTIIVTNTVLSIGMYVGGASGHPTTLDLRVAGNTFNASRRYNFSQLYGPLYTRVPNALSSGSWLVLDGASAVWDLCGTDQSVCLFHGTSGSKVTSATPATLTIAATHQSSTEQVTQDVNQLGGTNRVSLVAYEGQVSVVKSGEVKHTFGATSSSTGTVTVTAGILLFNANGKWPNCTGVTVTGGLLDVQNVNAFGDLDRDPHAKAIADWSISSSAKVNLGYTGTIKCRHLLVDDVKVSGTVGAEGSGADREFACLTGTGFLKVVPDSTAIVFR